MSKENSDFPVYDEEEAISFIRATLPEDVNARYSDDDIQEMIDALWDYYDDKGMTSLDDLDRDTDMEDAGEMAREVIKPLLKNGPKGINVADLTLIIKGEIAYEEDLDGSI